MGLCDPALGHLGVDDGGSLREVGMDFTGLVVVVVGGSGGLGASICRYVSFHGADVAVLYHGNESGADAIVKTLRDQGKKAQSFQVDVADRGSVDRALAGVVSAFGTVDVLINSAGISRNGVTWKIREEDWTSTLDVNLTGVFQCTRATLNIMREKGKGRIINISSVVGQTGIPGTSAYAASKAGIEGFTRATAVEVAKRGITINALALGYFDAGIIVEVPHDKLEKILETIPVGRLGRVEEVCHAIGFLCDEAASYITGQTININGGLYLG